MLRYVTATEIAQLYAVTRAEVYRLANEHDWRRSADNRRPVLYDAGDVCETMMRQVRVKKPLRVTA